MINEFLPIREGIYDCTDVDIGPSIVKALERFPASTTKVVISNEIETDISKIPEELENFTDRGGKFIFLGTVFEDSILMDMAQRGDAVIIAQISGWRMDPSSKIAADENPAVKVFKNNFELIKK
ncbi:MAG: hypothetical protein A2X48_17960 [Lentisphaerae bacterium GWF2_49_21]|nr:MAG: hypothetical protein A2X48_17960 [Lentisphaerae bacterium GWF2_49_21]